MKEEQNEKHNRLNLCSKADHYENQPKKENVHTEAASSFQVVDWSTLSNGNTHTNKWTSKINKTNKTRIKDTYHKERQCMKKMRSKVKGQSFGLVEQQQAC